MVRVYKRKTDRGNASLERLLQASKAVSDGSKYKTAAEQYGIDRMTLKRFIKRQKQTPANQNISTGLTHLADVKKVLNNTYEAELAAHVTKLADMYFGISADKFRKLAYEFAKANDITIPAAWERNRKAGIEWFRSFRNRHGLSVRIPEATSVARATAFNSRVVNKFYNNLASVLDEHAFEPQDIYNCDESGCHTVQTPGKVITRRGQKRVGAITSRERGELVTLVYTVNALGNVLPPMFIFPRVRFKNHFLSLAPSGSTGVASKTGWMKEDIFPTYLEHIKKYSRCSQEHPILLILDNHESHTSLASVDFAKENGITLLTIPPHTSHRLQPLDVTVFGPFKRSYTTAVDGWMRSNPGKTVTIHDIPGLVKAAQEVAMTSRNIVSGFKNTGIFPFNRDTFTESDFASADVYDQPLTLEDPDEPDTFDATAEENITDLAHGDVNEDAEIPLIEIPETTNQPTSPQPCSSAITTSPQLGDHQPCSSAMPSHTPVRDLLPLPKAPPRKNTKKRRKTGSTRILTDTPVRNEIANAKMQREQRKNKPKRRKILKKIPNKKARHPPQESSDEDCNTMPIPFADSSSDCDLSDAEIVEGDFVVVNITGKSRVVPYIARIDSFEDGEYEGVFLKKIQSVPGNFEKLLFVIDKDDGASFTKDDIVHKLPSPHFRSGSERKSHQLYFNANLSAFNL